MRAMCRAAIKMNAGGEGARFNMLSVGQRCASSLANPRAPKALVFAYLGAIPQNCAVRTAREEGLLDGACGGATEGFPKSGERRK